MKNLYLLLFLTLSLFAQGKVIYVNGSYTGTDTLGTSWETPFVDLYQAVAHADSADEVWVAGGVYNLRTGNLNALDPVEIDKSLSIYGSFSGSEESIYEREMTDTTMLVAVGSSFWGGYFDLISDGDVFLIDGFHVKRVHTLLKLEASNSTLIQQNITIDTSGVWMDVGEYGDELDLRVNNCEINSLSTFFVSQTSFKTFYVGNSEFYNCSSSFEIFDCVDAKIQNTNFINCSPSSTLIRFADSEGKLDGCILNNSGYVRTEYSLAKLSVSNSKFQNQNLAYSIYCPNAIYASIDNCLFADDTITAGIFYGNPDTLVITNTTFTNNQGQILNVTNGNQYCEINGCRFEENAIEGNEFMLRLGADAVFSHLIFYANIGGLVYLNEGGRLTESIFVKNVGNLNGTELIRSSNILNIFQSVFEENVYSGMLIRNSSGLYHISNSFFKRNIVNGDFLLTTSGTYKVKNSVFSFNQTDRNLFNNSGNNVDVEHSIFYNNNCEWYSNGRFNVGNSAFIHGPQTLSSNVAITQNCFADSLLPGTNNITGDPQFIDPENGDFRLRCTSPLINAGSNEFVTTEFDLDGNPRIQGGTVDIGPFESGFNPQEGQAPELNFTISNAAPCRTESIQFVSTTQPSMGNSLIWDFGDGSAVEYGDTVWHVYEESGEYEVKLTAVNACGISDSLSQMVSVRTTAKPQLFYPTVAEPNTTVKFYTNATCGNWLWEVENGDIISGQGTDTVYVNWNNGLAGNGHIRLDVSSCNLDEFCELPVEADIPLVPIVYEIRGPTIMCNDSIGTYKINSLARAPGTMFSWYVTGGEIIGESSGYNLDSIQVHWDNSATDAKVYLTIENTVVNAEKTDSLAVYIRPTYSINSTTGVCSNSTSSVKGTRMTNDFTWSYSGGVDSISETGTVYWGELPGEYTLYAYPPQDTSFCLSVDSNTVTVSQIPKVDSVWGERNIIVGQEYTYQITPFDTTAAYYWFVNNSQVATNVETVTFTWPRSSGSYALRCYVRSADNTACVYGNVPLNPLSVFEFIIRGNNRFCINDEAEFSCNTDTIPSENYRWFVNGELVSFGDTTFSYSFLEPGSYTVRVEAERNGFNYFKEKEVQVFGTPFLVLLIGQRRIDPEGLGTYSYEVNTSGVAYSYSVQGASSHSQDADTITVTWDGSEELSITFMAEEPIDTCPALPTIIPISRYDSLPRVFLNNGVPACVNNTVTYTLQSDDITRNISWELPSGGTIIEQNDSWVTVQWGSASGEFSLTAHYERFGQRSITNNVEIHNLPSPSILTEAVCGNSATELVAGEAWLSYLWKFVDTDSVMSSQATAFGTRKGTYSLQVTDANGCVGEVSKYVKKVPIPSAHIEANASVLCYDTIDTLRIVELSTYSGESLSFAWYRNNELIEGETETTLQDTIWADSLYTNRYQVQTSQDGCTSLSEFKRIEVRECPPDTIIDPWNPDPVTDDPNCFTPAVSFEIEGFQPFTFRNTSLVYDSCVWHINGQEFEVFEPAPYTFPNIGSYTVVLQRGCRKYGKRVVISALPRFTVETATCAGQAVEFKDYTEFDPNVPIAGWSWNFGDGTEEAIIRDDVTRDTAHVFSEGTYIIGFSIYTDQNGVEKKNTVYDTIVVRTPPTANFSSRQFFCYDNLYEFQNESSSWAESVRLLWEFANGSSFTAETPLTRLPEGNQDVQLVVTDVNNCSDTAIQNINVLPVYERQDIQVSASAKICIGDSVLLQSPTGSEVDWYIDSVSLGINAISFYAKDAGNYTARYMWGDCEVATNELLVEHVLGNAALSAEETQCVGVNFSFELQNVGTYQKEFKWFKDDVLIENETDTELAFNAPTADDNGAYHVIITDLDYGCTKEFAPVNLTVYASPTQPNITPFTAYACFSDTAVLHYSNFNEGQYAVQWFVNEEPFAGIYDSLVVPDMEESAIATLRVTDPFTGCSSSRQANINVLPKIVPDLGDTIFACRSESVSLRSEYSNSSYAFEWYFEDDTLGSVNNYHLINYLKDTTAGIYSVKVKGTGNHFECFGYDSVEVFMKLSPQQPEILGSTSFCEGDNTILTSTVTRNIEWNTQQTSASILVQTGGSYYVTAEEPLTGCSLTRSVYVTMNPLPNFDFIAYGGPFEYCNTEYIIPVGLEDYESYQWYRDGEAIYDVNENLIIEEPGFYELELTSFEGCMATSMPIYFEPSECYGQECYVRTTADAVPIAPAYSLRHAINCANSNPGPDEIIFDIDGDGPFIIEPVEQLPSFTDRVYLNGFTQSGDSVFDIVLRGTNYDVHGLIFDENTGGSIVKGVVLDSMRTGVATRAINNGDIRFENNLFSRMEFTALRLRLNDGTAYIEQNSFDSCRSAIRAFNPSANYIIKNNYLQNISGHAIGVTNGEALIQGNIISGNYLVGIDSRTVLLGGENVIEDNIFLGIGEIAIEGSTNGSMLVRGNVIGDSLSNSDISQYVMRFYGSFEDTIVVENNFIHPISGRGILSYGDYYRVSEPPFYVRMYPVVFIRNNTLNFLVDSSTWDNDAMELRNAFVQNNTINNGNIYLHEKAFVEGNELYNSLRMGITASGETIRLSKNTITSTREDYSKAIYDGDNKLPATFTNYYKQDTTLFITGTSEPLDTVEIFLNDGRPQQALAFVTEAYADNSGRWTAEIPRGEYFNEASENYYVNTASLAWSTSELSNPFVVPCFDCSCTVVNNNDNGIGSLRNAIDRSHNGECLTIDFDFSAPREIVLDSVLRPITVPLKIEGLVLNNENAVTVIGDYFPTGFYVQNRGVQIQNMNIRSFRTGIFLEDSAATVLSNNLDANEVALEIRGDANTILGNCINCLVADTLYGRGIEITGSLNSIGNDTLPNAINFINDGVIVSTGTQNKILYNTIVGDTLAIEHANDGNNLYPSPFSLGIDTVDSEIYITGRASLSDYIQLFVSNMYGEHTVEFVADTTVASSGFAIKIPEAYIPTEENIFFVLTATDRNGNTSQLSEVIQLGNFPQNCIVTNTQNEGRGSLRAAVECVNEAADIQLSANIVFQLPANDREIMMQAPSFSIENTYGVKINEERAEVVVSTEENVNGFQLNGGSVSIKGLRFKHIDTVVLGFVDSLILSNNSFVDVMVLDIETGNYCSIDSNIIYGGYNPFKISGGRFDLTDNDFYDNGEFIAPYPIISDVVDTLKLVRNMFVFGSSTILNIRDSVKYLYLFNNQFPPLMSEYTYGIHAQGIVDQATIISNEIDVPIVFDRTSGFVNVIDNNINVANADAGYYNCAGVFKRNSVVAGNAGRNTFRSNFRVEENHFQYLTDTAAYVLGENVTFSKNIFEKTSKAIHLLNGANQNKQPASFSDYSFENGGVRINGTSEPYDVVELFHTSGAEEEALAYIATDAADAVGNWSIFIPVGDFYSVEQAWYYTNTATAGGNTSELAKPVFKVPCLDCACMVTSTEDAGVGTLRAAFDSVNAGVCLNVRFDIQDTIHIESALPVLRNPVKIEGPDFTSEPLVFIKSEFGYTGIILTEEKSSVSNLGFGSWDRAIQVVGDSSVIESNTFKNNGVSVMLQSDNNAVLLNEFEVDKSLLYTGLYVMGNNNKIGIDSADAIFGNRFTDYFIGMTIESGIQNTIVNNSYVNTENFIMHSLYGNEYYPVPDTLLGHLNNGIGTISGYSNANDRIQVFTSNQYGGEANRLALDTLVNAGSWEIVIPSEYLYSNRNSYFVLSATSTDGNTSEMSELIEIGNFPAACYVFNTENSGRGSLRNAMECANTSNVPVSVLFDMPQATNTINVVDSGFSIWNDVGVTVNASGFTIQLWNADSISTAYKVLAENASIRNMRIYGFDTAIAITANNADVRVNYLYDNTTAITVNNALNAYLFSNFIDGAEKGIIFNNSQGNMNSNRIGVSTSRELRGNAIEVVNSSSANISNGTIQNISCVESTDSLGYGVYSENSTIYLNSNTFTNISNNAFLSVGISPSSIVRNCTFNGIDTAIVLNDSISIFNAIGNTFSSNVPVAIVSNVNLSSSVISQNEVFANEKGFELNAFNQQLTLDSNVFERISGSALVIENLHNSTISNNKFAAYDSSAVLNGSAIEIEKATWNTITNNHIGKTDSSSIKLLSSNHNILRNNVVGITEEYQGGVVGRYAFEVMGDALVDSNEVYLAKEYALYIEDSSEVNANLFYQAGKGGVYVKDSAVTISQNGIMSDSVGFKAIDLHNVANMQKSVPAIETFYRQNSDLYLSGKSEPNDLVEVFRNNSIPQNCIGFVGEARADTSGNWQVRIQEGIYFNPSERNYYVATATNSLNTSEVSEPFEVGCFDCICLVENSNDANAGSLRAQVDSAHTGLCYTIQFSPNIQDTIQLDSALREITVPLVISGNVDTTFISGYGFNGFELNQKGSEIENILLAGFDTAIVVNKDYGLLHNLKIVRSSLPIYLEADSCFVSGGCMNCESSETDYGIYISGSYNTIGSEISPIHISNTQVGVVVNKGVGNSIVYNAIVGSDTAILHLNNGNDNYPAPINLVGRQVGMIGTITGEANIGDVVHVYLSEYFGAQVYEFVSEVEVVTGSFEITIPSEYLSDTENSFFVLTATSSNGSTSELSGPIKVGDFEMVCYVVNTDNEGEGSLRDAISCVNNAEADGVSARIEFDLPNSENEIVLLDSGLVVANQYGVRIPAEGVGLTISSENLPFAFQLERGRTEISHIAMSGFETAVVSNTVGTNLSNNVLSNSQVGLRIANDRALTISHNTFSNTDSAIVVGSGSGYISFNTMGTDSIGSFYSGVTVLNAELLSVSSNTITGVSGNFIEIHNANGLAVSYNILTTDSVKASAGIRLDYCSNVTARGNTVLNATTGLSCDSLVIATFENNRFNRIDSFAINLMRSDSVLLRENLARNISESGKAYNLHYDTELESNQGYLPPLLQSATYKNGALELRGTTAEYQTVEIYRSDSIGNDLELYLGNATADLFGTFTFNYTTGLDSVNYFYFKAVALRKQVGDIDEYASSEASVAYSPNIKTCYVTSLSSSAEIEGSFPYNILIANDGECNVMLFNIPVANPVISASQAFPVITANNLTIDATYQGGYNGTPRISVSKGGSNPSALRVNTRGSLAIHGLNFENFETPIQIQEVGQLQVTKSHFTDFTEEAVDFGDNQHQRVVLDSNLFVSSVAPYALRIDKHTTEIRNSSFNVNDTAIIVTADTVTVYNNEFVNPNAIPNRCAVSLSGVKDTASVIDNTIESYHTGVKVFNSSNIFVSSNSIEGNELSENIYGILAEGSDSCYINVNNFSIIDSAVVVRGGTFMGIAGNQIDSALVAIRIEQANSTIVSGNYISNVNTGVESENAFKPIITQNYIWDQLYAGIHLKEGTDSAKVLKNKLGGMFLDDVFKNEGAGVVVDCNNALIGGNLASKNNIYNNTLGGVLVNSGQGNTITYNTIINNDTIFTPNVHLAISVQSSANGNILAPVIDSAHASTGNAVFEVFGESAPSDSIHLYFSEGFRQNVHHFAGVAFADEAGRWSCAIDTAQLNIPTKKHTFTLVATSTDSLGNTSELSNMLFVGTCYVTNTEESDSGVVAIPNSLRQAFECANSQVEPGVVKCAIERGGEIVVSLNTPLPEIYNPEGFTYNGLNKKYGRNLKISNSFREFPPTYYISTNSNAGAVTFENVTAQYADTLFKFTSSNILVDGAELEYIDALVVHFENAGENYSFKRISADRSFNASFINTALAIHNIEVDSSEFRKFHQAFVLENVVGFNFEGNETNECDTLLLIKNSSDVVISKNNIALYNNTAGVISNHVQGRILENDFSSDYLLDFITHTGNESLLIAGNNFKDKCISCVKLESASNVLVSDNEFDKVRDYAVDIRNSFDVELRNNEVKQIDSLGFNLVNSERIHMSRNLVKGFQNYWTIGDTVYAININPDVLGMVSNNNKPRPIITGHEVRSYEISCIDSAELRTTLFLLGTAEPNDTVEVYFTDSEFPSLLEFIIDVQADATGNWEAAIPREKYYKDFEKEYGFVVVATDPLGNTSEVSNPYRTSEVFNDLVVTHTGDTGVHSLRDAVQKMNCSDVRNRVFFNIETAPPHQITLVDTLSVINTYLGFEMDGFTQYRYAVAEGLIPEVHDEELEKINHSISIRNSNFHPDSALFNLHAENYASVMKNLWFDEVPKIIRTRKVGNVFTGIHAEGGALGDTAMIFKNVGGQTLRESFISEYNVAVALDTFSSNNTIERNVFDDVQIAVSVRDGATFNNINENKIFADSVGVFIRNVEAFNSIRENQFGSEDNIIKGEALRLHNASNQFIIGNIMLVGDTVDRNKAFIHITGESDYLTIMDNKLGTNDEGDFVGISAMKGIWFDADSGGVFQGVTLSQNEIVGVTKDAIVGDSLQGAIISTNYLGVDKYFNTKGNSRNYSYVPGVGGSAVYLSNSEGCTINGNVIVNYWNYGINLDSSRLNQIKKNRVFSEFTTRRGINLGLGTSRYSNDSVLAPVIDTAIMLNNVTIRLEGHVDYPNSTIEIFEAFDKDMQASRYLGDIIADASGRWSVELPTENFGFTDYNKYVAQVTVGENSSEFSHIYRMPPLLCALMDQPGGLDIFVDRYTPCPQSDFMLDPRMDGLNYEWYPSNGEFDTIRTRFAQIDTSAIVTFRTYDNFNCVHTEQFTVDYKEQPVEPEFIISSTNYVGDTIVLVDILDSVLEQYDWIVPEGVEVVSQGEIITDRIGQSGRELRFVVPEVGSYTIEQVSILNGCFLKLSKTIQAEEKDPNMPDPYELTPSVQDLFVNPSPVPSGEVTNAYVQTTNESLVELKLLDVGGAVLFQRLLSGETHYIIELPTSNLTAGTYLVSLISDRETISFKFAVE